MQNTKMSATYVRIVFLRLPLVLTKSNSFKAETWLEYHLQ